MLLVAIIWVRLGIGRRGLLKTNIVNINRLKVTLSKTFFRLSFKNAEPITIVFALDQLAWKAFMAHTFFLGSQDLVFELRI